MLRCARESDKNDIKRLWQSSFGDSEAYIDFYLEHKYDPNKTVLLEVDNMVIGMAHLLPCTLRPKQKALYWYAVCIDEKMRNKGYFRHLVTEVLKETKRRGFVNLCVPAPGLESVYQKMGFHNSYLADDIAFVRENSNFPSNKTSFLKANPEDFINLFREEGSTVWSLDAIHYAFEENEYTGGKQIKFQFEGKTYFAFAINKENHYLIDYHNISQNVFEKIKYDLFTELNCEKILFRAPGNGKIVGLSDSDLVNLNSRITITLG